MAHTPGPWRVGDAGCSVFGPKKSDGSLPAVIATKVRPGNATLIAAAPDLLAALEAIERGLTNGQKERGETFQSIARAAIAKAKGGA